MSVEIQDLTNLMEWNRWAEERKTVLETLTTLNNRYREAISTLNQRLIERTADMLAKLVEVERTARLWEKRYNEQTATLALTAQERDEARAALDSTQHELNMQIFKGRGMGTAIEAALEALCAWNRSGLGMSTDFTKQSAAFRTGQIALTKLKPFLKP